MGQIKSKISCVVATRKFFKRKGAKVPRDLSLRLIQCYGATTAIFSLLDAVEVLKLQGLNKHMYSFGVSRVQYHFYLREVQYMSHPYGKTFKDTLLCVINKRLQKDGGPVSVRKIVNPTFDLTDFRII